MTHYWRELDQAKELLETSERVIGQHEQVIIALRSQIAALLEAAEGALPLLVFWHTIMPDYPLPKDRQLPVTIAKLRAAIAQAEPKEVQ